jgi:hypothetical protein
MQKLVGDTTTVTAPAISFFVTISWMAVPTPGSLGMAPKDTFEMKTNSPSESAQRFI